MGAQRAWSPFEFFEWVIAADRSDSELGRLMVVEDGPGDWSPKLLTLSREGHSEQVANVFFIQKVFIEGILRPRDCSRH